MKGKRCGICHRRARLVRDHDHATGHIRGRLCIPCNGRLGAYEAEKRRGPYVTAPGYLWWVRKFHDRIEEHLRKDTGVKYKPRPPRPRKRKKEEHPVPVDPLTPWQERQEEARALLRQITDEWR